MGLLLRFAGYIATHIVQQLLQKGYRVRGTVRDPTNEKKTKVLRDIAEKVSWAHLSSVVLPPPQRPTPNAQRPLVWSLPRIHVLVCLHECRREQATVWSWSRLTCLKKEALMMP